VSRFDQIYRRSLDDPEGFWAQAGEAIDWDEPWERVLDDSRAPFYRWFAGGRMNSCHNALDRHVEQGRGDQAALIYDSPVTDTVARFTYRELRDAVAQFAGSLVTQGVGHGDRVIIYMPMVPEAVIAMLACARLGAIHSVVFGGFASNELATRIEDAKPKAVVSASCGIEPDRLIAYKPLLDAAIEQVESKPSRCIILLRPCSRPSSIRAATSSGTKRSPASTRPAASQSRQRIRSTSSTRPARPDNRKESSATTAVTQSRSNGR
jgi:propionyl-CoA synthetase